MEYDVTFDAGCEALGGVRHGRLMRLSAEGSALILRDPVSGTDILLGDVRRLCRDCVPALSAEEHEALGCAAGSEQAVPETVEVLCRLGIPHQRPQDAGFDLSRLVLVNTANGKGLEVMRPGAGLIPLAMRD